MINEYNECPEGEVMWELNEGHPRIRTWPNGGQFKAHRLASVAWFGYECVKNKDVHHRVPVKWLNTESNLIPIPNSEHMQLTQHQREYGITDKIVDDVVNGLEVSKWYDDFLSEVDIDDIEI